MKAILGVTVESLAGPAVRTATVTGAAVDVRDYDGDVAFIQDSGAGTGTLPTLDGKIQDSADGSTDWADITGWAFAQVTTAASLQILKRTVNASRRYIRYVGTITGTTPSFTFGVTMAGQKQIV